MIRGFLLVLLLLSAFANADPSCSVRTASENGLSGYPYLPTSDVLEEGILRIQGRMEYLDCHDNGHLFRLPLSAAYGPSKDFEFAAMLPLYLSDDAWNGTFCGDVRFSGAWKYETARGGSALQFNGGLSLPTGTENRDPGTELFFGAASSTTFRLFRMSAAAEYVLNGQKNPFEDRITDYMRLSCGGTSYVTSDVVISGSLSGTTRGELSVVGGVTAYPWESTALLGSITAGLDGPFDFGISAGVSWTGTGF